MNLSSIFHSNAFKAAAPPVLKKLRGTISEDSGSASHENDDKDSDSPAGDEDSDEGRVYYLFPNIVPPHSIVSHSPLLI